MTLPALLQLNPTYRDYVWGGQRLRPGPDLTAEAWIIYEGNQVIDLGLTLAGARLKCSSARQLWDGPLPIPCSFCCCWISSGIRQARFSGHFREAFPGQQI